MCATASTAPRSQRSAPPLPPAFAPAAGEPGAAESGAGALAAGVPAWAPAADMAMVAVPSTKARREMSADCDMLAPRRLTQAMNGVATVDFSAQWHGNRSPCSAVLGLSSYQAHTPAGSEAGRARLINRGHPGYCRIGE